MKNLSQVLQNLYNTEIKVSGEKVHQVQGRTIKAQILNALMQDLTENGISVGKVEKGFIAKIGDLVLNFDTAIIAEQERLAEIELNKKAKSKKSAK